MAETAASSPIRPLTMMKGRSTSPLRLSNPSAANELKAGMEWSEMMRSQPPPSSAASMAAGVSTRSHAGSYPPLRNILTRSRASSSESSTSKTLSAIPIQAQAPRRPQPVFLCAYNRQRSDRSSSATIVFVISITSSSILLLPGRRGNLLPEGKTSENTSFRGCVGLPCRAIMEGPGYRHTPRLVRKESRCNKTPTSAGSGNAFPGPARLAAIQRPFSEGALPRPAGALVPDSLDRHLYRLCSRYGSPLASDVRHSRHLAGSARVRARHRAPGPRLLRRLQGEPGHRLPLPLHRGFDRRPAARGLRRSRPNKYSDMPHRYTRVRERIRTRRPRGDGLGAR